MPEGRRQREPAPSSPTPGLRAAAGGLRPARLGGADGGSRSPGGKGGGAGTSGFSHLAHGLHRPPRGPLSDQRRGPPPGRPQALGIHFPPPPASPGLKIRVSKPPVTTRHEVPPHFAASGMRGVHLCGGIGGRKWRGTERALLAVRGPLPARTPGSQRPCLLMAPGSSPGPAGCPPACLQLRFLLSPQPRLRDGPLSLGPWGGDSEQQRWGWGESGRPELGPQFLLLGIT